MHLFVFLCPVPTLCKQQTCTQLSTHGCVVLKWGVVRRSIILHHWTKKNSVPCYLIYLRYSDRRCFLHTDAQMEGFTVNVSMRAAVKSLQGILWDSNSVLKPWTCGMSARAQNCNYIRGNAINISLINGIFIYPPVYCQEVRMIILLHFLQIHNEQTRQAYIGNWTPMNNERNLRQVPALCSLLHRNEHTLTNSCHTLRSVCLFRYGPLFSLEMNSYFYFKKIPGKVHIYQISDFYKHKLVS